MAAPLTLDDFIDRLLEEKHKGVDIPPENRNQMKEEMRESLNKLISVKMLEQLSPVEMTEFLDLQDKGTADEALQQYIADHVGPKLKQKDIFLADILSEFHQAYLG